MRRAGTHRAQLPEGSTAGKRQGRPVEQELLRRPSPTHSSSSATPAISTSSNKAAPQAGRPKDERRKTYSQAVATGNSYTVLDVADDKDSEDEPPDKAEEGGAAERLLSASSRASRSSTIVARGELDGVACADMLIDTGASCSFVRRSWAASSGMAIRPLKERVTVTLADQRTTVCTHEVAVSRMSVHGSVAPCSLMVMDELSDAVIVGMSWQRAARLTIAPGHPHDLLNGQPAQGAAESGAGDAAQAGPAEGLTSWRAVVPAVSCADAPAVSCDGESAGVTQRLMSAQATAEGARQQPSAGARAEPGTSACSPRRCPSRRPSRSLRRISSASCWSATTCGQ